MCGLECLHLKPPICTLLPLLLTQAQCYQLYRSQAREGRGVSNTERYSQHSGLEELSIHHVPCGAAPDLGWVSSC